MTSAAFALKALDVARNAALESVALRWDDRVLGPDELPAELIAERPLVLIYLMPRVFKFLGLPVASTFATLWQYGGTDSGKLSNDALVPGGGFYWKFSVKALSGSQTVQNVVKNSLASYLQALPSMGTIAGVHDEQWSDLRRLANTFRAVHEGKDEWTEQSPDFRLVVASPKIYLGYKTVDTGTYLANGESPLKSDAYASIGPFGLRGYLSATFRKRAGDERVYVKPRKVGVRIWDDYNFGDDNVSKISGILLAGRASQFLGYWKNTRNGEFISLKNSDFSRFRDFFRPRYNSFLNDKRSAKPRLLCQDFSPISDFVEQDVAAPDEYPLLALS